MRSAQPSIQALLELVLELPAHLTPQATVRAFACSAGAHFDLAAKQPTVAGAVGASLLGRPLGPHDRALINAALVLMADHELNPSTFAARVAASAGAPVKACLVSALGAAAGTRHASACDLAEAFWRDALAAKRFVPHDDPPPGFEAGAYPRGDPRAEKLLALLRSQWSAALGRRVDAILSAVDEATGQLPGVDTALALVALHLGLSPGAATALFVVGRVPGWLAHIAEQQTDASFIRPRARYCPPP